MIKLKRWKIVLDNRRIIYKDNKDVRQDCLCFFSSVIREEVESSFLRNEVTKYRSYIGRNEFFFFFELNLHVCNN